MSELKREGNEARMAQESPINPKHLHRQQEAAAAKAQKNDKVADKFYRIVGNKIQEITQMKSGKLFSTFYGFVKILKTDADSVKRNAKMSAWIKEQNKLGKIRYE